MSEANAVVLPPGVLPTARKDVPLLLIKDVGTLMRRHHHAADSTCTWCIVTAGRVLADAMNLIKAHAHRDDPVAAFIRRHRDQRTQQDEVGTAAYGALDDLLDEYRLCADTGRLITEPPEYPVDGEGTYLPDPRVVPGLTAADHEEISSLYDRAYLTYLGANIEHPDDASDAGLNREAQAHQHALSEVAAHAYSLAEDRRTNDTGNFLVMYRDLSHYPSRADPGTCCCGEEIEGEGWMAGCVHFQHLTEVINEVRAGGEDPLPSVLHRAVDGFARSGDIPDADVFGDVLAELGDKLVDEFRVFRVAFHSDQVGRLRYPVAVLDKAMAVLSALTAALNRPRTPTAPEVVDRERTEQVTAAGDAVRMHLVSHHWLPPALGMTDAAAGRLHGYLHAGRFGRPVGMPHDEDDTAYDIDTAIMVVAKIPDGEGGATWRQLLREQRDRLVFGVDGQA